MKQSDIAPRINSIGGLGWAGLSGGPLGILLLIFFDLRIIGRLSEFRRILLWFLPLIALWIAVSWVVPDDLISQLIPFFPQVLLWWLVMRRLLPTSYGQLRMGDVIFRSKWRTLWLSFLAMLAIHAPIAGVIWFFV